MQRQPMQFNAPTPYRCFARGREMQTRGGSCDRALIACEHGLVVGRVPVVGRAFRRDVRRQRWLAEIGDRLIERGPVERKRQRDLALVALGCDLGVEMAEQTYL